MKWILWILVVGLAVAGFLLRRKLRSTQADLHRLEHERQALQEEKKILFDFLHDLGEAFTENIDRTQVLSVIMRCARRVCDARGGAIYLWDPERKRLKAEAIIGIFPPPFPVPDAVADKIATREEYLETMLRNEPLARESDSVIVRAAREKRPVLVELADGTGLFPDFREYALKTHTYIAVPLQYRGDDLGVIALANREDGHSFTTSDLEIIKSVADQASYSLHHAQIYSQLADKRKMDHDLKMAREIQRILLPDEAPKIDEYELAALNLPAQQVSGDYYDFISVSEDVWGLAIADVSGKGIPASLIMAMCRSVLRSKAEGCNSPAKVLSAVNRQLYPDIREDMFITMVYLTINTKTHELRLARAGHEAPLICMNNFENVDLINPPGMALGIDSGSVFDELIQDAIITMQPHDTVVLYTDGISEAVDERGEEFGREHLKEALRTSAPRGVDVLVKNIVERVQRFSSGQAQNDDITLAAIQRKEV
jgi:phosphoserine phosphatase RsbU/P